MEKNCYLIKDFLWKCFWVGFVISILMGLLWIPNKEVLSQFANQMVGIAPEDYYQIGFNFLAYSKIFLIYIFLVPAIAASCMCKCCKCKGE